MKIQGSTTINRRVDGENAIVYSLNPSHNIIQFSIDSSTGKYAPESIDFTCGYCRTDGKSTSVYSGTLRSDTITKTPEGDTIATLFRYIKKDGSYYPTESSGWIWSKDRPTADNSKSYTGKNLCETITSSTEYASIECILTKNLSTSAGLSNSDDEVIDRIIVPIVKESNSIKSITNWYKRTSTTSSDNATFTYGSEAQGGWSTEISSTDTTKYLWLTLVCEFVNGTHTITGPMIIGSMGDKGTSINNVVVKYCNLASKTDLYADSYSYTDSPVEPTSTYPYQYRATLFFDTNNDLVKTTWELIKIYAVNYSYDEVAYNITSSSSPIPTSGWEDSLSKINIIEGYYLWTRRIPVRSDGTQGTPSYTVTHLGTSATKTGSTTDYAVTTTNTAPNDSDWKLLSEIQSSIVPGVYVWRRITYTWSSGDPTYDITVLYQGKDGATVSGLNSYMHIAYSTSADGSDNFYYASELTGDNDINFTYIGVCSSSVSTDNRSDGAALIPSDYSWTRLAAYGQAYYTIIPSSSVVVYDPETETYSPSTLSYVLNKQEDGEITTISSMPDYCDVIAVYKYDAGDSIDSESSALDINESLKFNGATNGLKLYSDIELRFVKNGQTISSVTVPLLSQESKVLTIIDLYRTTTTNDAPDTPSAVDVIKAYGYGGTYYDKSKLLWSTDAPTVDSDNCYLWNNTITVYYKKYNLSFPAYVLSGVSYVGKFQKSISSIVDQYAYSNINSHSELTKAIQYNLVSVLLSPTGGSLSSTTKYLWNRERITYDDGSSPEYTDWRIIGIYGEPGADAVTYDIILSSDVIYCNSSGEPLLGLNFFAYVTKTIKGNTAILESSDDVMFMFCYRPNTINDITTYTFDPELDGDVLTEYSETLSGGQYNLYTDTYDYCSVDFVSNGYIGKVCLVDVSSGTIIAKKDIIFSKQGEKGIGLTGLTGCIQRSSQWEPGKVYHNDAELKLESGQVGYIDTVWFRQDDGSYNGYVCIQTHTSAISQSTSNSGNKPPEDVVISNGSTIYSATTSTVWKAIENSEPMSVPFLFANYATINMLLGDQILIQHKDEDTGLFSIDAGLVGGDYPLWIGATLPVDSSGNKAPFVVSREGVVEATGGIFNNATIGSATIGNSTMTTNIVNASYSPWCAAEGSYGSYSNDNVYSYKVSRHYLQNTAKNCGRIIRITSDDLNEASTSDKNAVIEILNRQDNLYFYEDGIKKTKLSLSNELVELIGVGKDELKGYLVLNRVDISTRKRMGRPMQMLAVGRVDVSYFSGVGYVPTITYSAFDGSSYVENESYSAEKIKMSVTRVASDGYGSYKVTFPETWCENANDLIIMVTGEGYVFYDNYNGNRTTSSPANATVVERTTRSFTVRISDDDSPNDGSFSFMIMNMRAWATINGAIDLF